MAAQYNNYEPMSEHLGYAVRRWEHGTDTMDTEGTFIEAEVYDSGQQFLTNDMLRLVGEVVPTPYVEKFIISPTAGTETSPTGNIELTVRAKIKEQFGKNSMPSWFDVPNYSEYFKIYFILIADAESDIQGWKTRVISPEWRFHRLSSEFNDRTSISSIEEALDSYVSLGLIVDYQAVSLKEAEISPEAELASASGLGSYGSGVYGEAGVYEIPYEAKFSFPGDDLRHLGILYFTHLDISSLIDNYGVDVNPSSRGGFLRSFGSYGKYETILETSEGSSIALPPRTMTAFVDLQGNQWFGSWHVSDGKYMSGPAYSNTEGSNSHNSLELRALQVPNNKVSDLRKVASLGDQFYGGDDFYNTNPDGGLLNVEDVAYGEDQIFLKSLARHPIENATYMAADPRRRTPGTASQKIKNRVMKTAAELYKDSYIQRPDFMSESEITRQSDGSLAIISTINFLDLIKNNSPYSKFYRNQEELAAIALDYSVIRSIKVFRRRVEISGGCVDNRLSRDSICPFDPENESPEMIVSSSENPTTGIITSRSYPPSVSKKTGRIEEVGVYLDSVPDLSHYRSFFIKDLSLEGINAGTFQYYLELEVEDGLPHYIAQRLEAFLASIGEFKALYDFCCIPYQNLKTFQETASGLGFTTEIVDTLPVGSYDYEKQSFWSTASASWSPPEDSTGVVIDIVEKFYELMTYAYGPAHSQADYLSKKHHDRALNRENNATNRDRMIEMMTPTSNSFTLEGMGLFLKSCVELAGNIKKITGASAWERVGASGSSSLKAKEIIRTTSYINKIYNADTSGQLQVSYFEWKLGSDPKITWQDYKKSSLVEVTKWSGGAVRSSRYQTPRYYHYRIPEIYSFPDLSSDSPGYTAVLDITREDIESRKLMTDKHQYLDYVFSIMNEFHASSHANNNNKTYSFTYVPKQLNTDYASKRMQMRQIGSSKENDLEMRDPVAGIDRTLLRAAVVMQNFDNAHNAGISFEVSEPRQQRASNFLSIQDPLGFYASSIVESLFSMEDSEIKSQEQERMMELYEKFTTELGKGLSEQLSNIAASALLGDQDTDDTPIDQLDVVDVVQAFRSGLADTKSKGIPPQIADAGLAGEQSLIPGAVHINNQIMYSNYVHGLLGCMKYKTYINGTRPIREVEKYSQMYIESVTGVRTNIRSRYSVNSGLRRAARLDSLISRFYYLCKVEFYENDLLGFKESYIRRNIDIENEYFLLKV